MGAHRNTALTLDFVAPAPGTSQKSGRESACFQGQEPHTWHRPWHTGSWLLSVNSEHPFLMPLGRGSSCRTYSCKVECPEGTFRPTDVQVQLPVAPKNSENSFPSVFYSSGTGFPEPLSQTGRYSCWRFVNCQRIPTLSEFPKERAWLDPEHPQPPAVDFLREGGVMIPGLSASRDCVKTHILDVHTHFIAQYIPRATGG